MGAMPDTGAVPSFLYNAFRFHEGLKTKGATMKVERIGESGALSQKTRAGAWIFVSGQRPKSENGSILGLGDFEAQADAALESLAQTLNQAGAPHRCHKTHGLPGKAPGHRHLPRHLLPHLPHPAPHRDYSSSVLPSGPRRPDRNRSLCLPQI